MELGVELIMELVMVPVTELGVEIVMVLIGFLELKAIWIVKVETFGLGVPKVSVHMQQVIVGVVVEIIELFVLV